MKLVPVMVTLFATPATTEAGDTEVMVGAEGFTVHGAVPTPESGLVMVTVVALVPSSVPSGVNVAVICVELTQFTAVTAPPVMVIVAPFWKPVPTKVTFVEPGGRPDVGVIDVTAGAGVMV